MENEWAWKMDALKMKVQHTLYKGTHKGDVFEHLFNLIR
jgi:hypothetical protein